MPSKKNSKRLNGEMKSKDKEALLKIYNRYQSLTLTFNEFETLGNDDKYNYLIKYIEKNEPTYMNKKLKDYSCYSRMRSIVFQNGYVSNTD